MHSSPTPPVSVVIPTYNRAGYVGEAVASAVAQGYSDLELIVVDDGSTDNTRDVLGRFEGSFTYAWQENRGVAAARNAGVDLAITDFLAFLDSDDLWEPDKIERQMRVLLDNPEVDAVYGMARQFTSPELSAEDRRRLSRMDGRVMEAPIACAMLIRRAAFERVGGFDERLRIGVEVDWYGRALDKGLKTVMLPQIVYHRRLHRTNLNVVHAGEQIERLHVIRELLARRKAVHP